MPRSIWNGTITFGLVNVPIKLYPATESKSIHFHEVHLPDGARIEHRRICPKDGQEVPADHVVKGYEVAPGEYVVLEKEEIKVAAGDRGKVIHIEEFVNARDIDPLFYEKTYYAGSRDDNDAYHLLHEALRRSGRAGIGRFTFHDREYLVALRALDEVLAMHTLRFHDEVVSGKEVAPEDAGRSPTAREIEMAERLVDALAERFDPQKYEDTYREAVLDLIRRKAAGKEIDIVEQEEPEYGDDLAAALEASLNTSNGRRSNGRRTKGKSRRSSGAGKSKARA
jgi:DNA end-binding protein Ku